MGVTLGRRYVAAPPFTPLPFGLLSISEPLTEGTTRWEAGVEYQPDSCFEALSTWDECIITGGSEQVRGQDYTFVHAVPTKSPSATGIPLGGAEPFTVYAGIWCAPTGIYEEYEQRTIAALTNGEGRAVERVFWTGNVAGTPEPVQHLASNATLTDEAGAVLVSAASPVTTGTPVDAVQAVGALECSLAECYGGIGVIHVPRTALAYLNAYGIIERDGQRLRTIGGNIVAAYSSNNKEGPDGTVAPAGQGWFYATGNVQIRRSPIRTVSRLNEAFDHANNWMILIAERTYVIDWDCCHFAAQVHLGAFDIGA